MYRHLASIALSALLASSAAAQSPVFQDSVLTIPRVDTVEQAGQFQSVRFERQSDGSWRLTGLETLRSPRLEPIRIDSVEVLKTSSFPVGVYLRAAGIQSSCGYDGLARVHERRLDQRFDIAISVRHTDFATEQLAKGSIACTADVRPFKMTVPLTVYGLRAGTYLFAINGVGGSFVLDRDNGFADDCDAGEPAERRQCR